MSDEIKNDNETNLQKEAEIDEFMKNFAGIKASEELVMEESAPEPSKTHAKTAEFVKTTNTDENELKIDGIIEIKKDTERNKKLSKTKKKRSRRWLKTLIWTMSILIISGTIAFFAVTGAVDFLGIKESTTITVEIPEGATTSEIADILKENGLIKYPFLYRLASKYMKFDGQYKYGEYDLDPSLGYKGIGEKLKQPGRSIAQGLKVTIPERAELDAISKILIENNITTKDLFYKEIKNGKFNFRFVEEIPRDKVQYILEGYLFPETYLFYKSEDDLQDSTKRAINKMLFQLEKILEKNNAYDKAKQVGYSIHEIMTMASIIELESSGNPGEMAKVSAVFYNRLNGINWSEAKYLGSCPTRDYATKYKNDKYNTYVGFTIGLPPGPMCAPSEKAIIAALNPEKDFDATYFCSDKNGKFYFNNSLKEHNAEVSRLKAAGMWLTGTDS